MFLESKLPIDSITVMVQKEAADRLCAEVGSRDGGAVTVAVNYYAESEILFFVPKDSFLPPPKVDSSVIKLTLRDKPPVEVKNEEFFFKVVKAAFSPFLFSKGTCRYDLDFFYIRSQMGTGQPFF